jgi:anthranilate phosphoribosyltransferase
MPMTELHDNTQFVGNIISRLNLLHDVSTDDIACCTNLILRRLVFHPDLTLGCFFSAVQTCISLEKLNEAAIWALYREVCLLDEIDIELQSPWDQDANVVGYSGAGKKSIQTYNISSLASIVAASLGCRTMKICSKGFTNKIGAIDRLTEMGVSTATDQTSLQRKKFGLAFVDIRSLAPNADRAYGSKFMWPNPVGYLSSVGFYRNPIKAVFLGIAHRDTELSARLLLRMGFQRAMVVNAYDQHHRIDEIASCLSTRVSEIHQGFIRSFEIPANPRHHIDDLALSIQPREKNLLEVTEWMRGHPNNCLTETICWNAGVLIYLDEKADTITHGKAMALESIEDGRTEDFLSKYLADTQVTK